MTCGLVHASYSEPKWQAVKLTFFAPWDVTKISSCQVNTISRWGIKQLVISFGSSFLLFTSRNEPGATFTTAGGNPSPGLLIETFRFKDKDDYEYEI